MLCAALLALAFIMPAGLAASIEGESELMDGIYLIRNKATGRALNMQLAGMVDRAFVQQFGDTGMLDELWRVETTDGLSRVTNLFSGRHLAVREDTPIVGSAIHVSVADSPGALWNIAEVGGAYRLSPPTDDKLALALPVNEIASKYLPTLIEAPLEDTGLWLLVKAALQEELPRMLPLTGLVFHASCPQIVKQDGVYYMIIMAPHIVIKSSKDLLHWEMSGTVFGESDPSWLRQEVPGYGIWAPAAFYVNGQYLLYYCISTLGSQNSAIGLVTNTTLDPKDPAYRWVDRGMVLRSKTGSPYNCIDPNLIGDEEGRYWLNFGSYWGGLYQVEIDPDTGLLKNPGAQAEDIVHLARRNVSNGAVEAPYMIYREGWYYLFVAFNPMDLSYHNRVGRSRSVHGPFVDRDGREMTKGGGSVVTKGLFELRMPGHASVFLDEDGQHYFVGEYFRKDSPSIMMISTIVWDKDGWPVTALTPDIADVLPEK